MENFSDKLNGIFDLYKTDENSKITILGEYIGVTGGKNYIKKALHGERYFCVFMVRIDNLIIYCPNMIKKLLFNHKNLKVIPYIKESFNVHFNDSSLSCNEFNMLDIINRINDEDPLLKEWFNISLKGEGLVGYPETIKFNIKEFKYEDFLFKIKTETYKLNKKENKLQNVVANYKDYENLVESFLTENRLQQGFNEICNSTYNIKLIGDFLKWINNDVLDESFYER